MKRNIVLSNLSRCDLWVPCTRSSDGLNILISVLLCVSRCCIEETFGNIVVWICTITSDPSADCGLASIDPFTDLPGRQTKVSQCNDFASLTVRLHSRHLPIAIINVSWAVEVGKADNVSVYLVENLFFMDLFNQLKAKGLRQPDYTKALIKEKLADKDHNIATTIYLLCLLVTFLQTTSILSLDTQTFLRPSHK